MLAFYIKTFLHIYFPWKSCCTTTVCNQEQMGKKKRNLWRCSQKGAEWGGAQLVAGSGLGLDRIWSWTRSNSARSRFDRDLRGPQSEISSMMGLKRTMIAKDWQVLSRCLATWTRNSRPKTRGSEQRYRRSHKALQRRSEVNFCGRWGFLSAFKFEHYYIDISHGLL